MELLQKEVEQLDGRVFDMNQPREASEVRHMDPDALFVDLHTVTGDRFADVELPDGAKIWKSRIVAGGSRLRDARGHQVKEETVHEAPVSFGEVRPLRGPAFPSTPDRGSQRFRHPLPP